MTQHARIDYGDLRPAEFYGDFTAETVERVFMNHANQCFGIRKSVMYFKLLSLEPTDLPHPWKKMRGAATVLKHSGDVIVWNKRGDKIKSEFD